MNNSVLEREILSSVQTLNGHQKHDVLDFIRNIEPKIHSKKLYRRRAMKQIREALSHF